MAAANPQPHITLSPFSGKADENWPDFESLVKSLINVGTIPNANRPQFLQLHLLDQALQFFRTLPQATRDDFDAAITALRNHYCNPNLRELHILQLHNLEFDQEHGSPEDFLEQVQIKATQAYPIQCYHQFRQLTHRMNKQKLTESRTHKMPTKQY